jgi:hypothetical protein
MRDLPSEIAAKVQGSTFWTATSSTGAQVRWSALEWSMHASDQPFDYPQKIMLYRAWQLGKYASHVSRLSLLVENLILPKT